MVALQATVGPKALPAVLCLLPLAVAVASGALARWWSVPAVAAGAGVALAAFGSAAELCVGVVAVTGAAAGALWGDRRDARRGQAVLAGRLRQQEYQLVQVTSDVAHSEALLETVLDQLPAGVVLVGPDGRLLRKNRQYHDIVGLPAALPPRLSQVVGYELTRPDGTPLPFDDWPVVRALRRGDRTDQQEVRIRRPDGTTAAVTITSSPVVGPAGERLGAVSVLLDVAERKIDEDRLRLLESAVVHARDAVIVLGAEPAEGRGRAVLYVNEAFTRMTGYAADEVVGRSLHFLRGPNTDPAALERLRQALDARTPLQLELLNYRKDGSEVWVELSLVPVIGAGGACARWVMIQRDIGDRKRAEQELRDREDRLRALGDNLPDGAVYQMLTRPDGSQACPYISAGIEAVLGVTPADAMADVGAVLRLFHPDDREAVRAAQAASHRDGVPLDIEFRAVTTSGELKWLHIRAMPQRLPDGGTLRNGVILDVTARKVAEEGVKRNEELFRGVFENAGAGVSLTGPTGTFVSVNPAFAALLGRPADEVIGRHPALFTHPDDWAAQEPLLTGCVAGRLDDYQLLKRYVRPDGGVVWTELSVAVVRDSAGEFRYALGVSVDVTERLRLEEQLRQAQKMEVVGQLAGGIAHDFNNLLTGMLGNLTRVGLPADHPGAEMIAAAERAALRAAELTKKMLGFARKSMLHVAPLRAADAADEVFAILRRTLDPRIRIVPDLDADAWVAADATLVHQALLNLCLNSRDAMPHGGTMTVGAARVRVTADDARHPEARPGEFVRVTVADTGTGMTDDVKARVFEPFFTTKGVGKGTGLGLAMVHGIVRQHGGWVECASAPGRGTRFDLYLPVGPESGRPPTTPLPRAVPDDLGPPPGGAPQTVLLVDDEDMIRDLGRSALEAAGYHVLEAQDGLDAVDLFRREHDRIDLVVLDLTMPRLSGRDAFRSMAEIEPGARVLFSTGYSADDLSDVTGAVGMLSKPYRPQELVSAVRRALADDDPSKGPAG